MFNTNDYKTVNLDYCWVGAMKSLSSQIGGKLPFTFTLMIFLEDLK